RRWTSCARSLGHLTVDLAERRSDRGELAQLTARDGGPEQLLLGPRLDDLEQGGGSLHVDDVDAGQVTDPAGVAVDREAVAHRPGGLELLTRAGSDDPALVEDDEPVTEPVDEVELVAGEEDRHAARGVLAEQVRHRVHRQRVEAGERL